jgi:hypothetical protein
MKKLKPTIITSLPELMEYVEAECKPDLILFRGQPEDKPLLPKIARSAFRTRTRNGDALQAERAMFETFQKRALPYLQREPVSSWEWLAFAQHHGLCTRLLDWTLNPLAAIWFAVENPPIGKATGVVWHFEVLSKDEELGEDPFKTRATKVFEPRHITTRIVSQSGWFTVHKYLDGKGKFIPLERNPTFSRRLRKLEIPAAAFSDLRRELDRCNVNGASLYGGIDGLCKHINWLNTLGSDEDPEPA